MIYDIIGDVHGQADKLEGLLHQLGYIYDGKSFVAPTNHKAIFIGDLIDRGSRQLDTLNIAFDMLDNQQAHIIMGNHEYNALAYATPNTIKNNGNYLREHTPHNTCQHQAFLDEVGFGTPLHKFWLNRFYELPLWLEFDSVIFIHACYDKHSMEHLKPMLTNNRLNTNTLQRTAQRDTPEFFALERLLKGMEAQLPAGITMTDKTGIVRTKARVKWWLDDWQHKPMNQTLFADGLPCTPLTHLVGEPDTTIDTHKPIFIGHYWLDGTPAILSKQVVCVDYSAGKDGYLTAYRFDTDNPKLDNGNFIQFIN